MTSTPISGVHYDDSLGSLDVVTLGARYRAAQLTPLDVVRALALRISSRGDDAVWIELALDDALDAATALGTTADPTMPLWGIPFAVKDNIDVAGSRTSAACPDFAYVADHTATAVSRLIDAGAIFIGKTNLDQFATGLSGTRSPYGAPRTPFDTSMISGGSSSGSAVAVSAGLVSFALGTDTAGSGRVPAAFTSVVGLKPSRGLVSNDGVVPACRSLDCVAVFALTVSDATTALAAIAGVDEFDPWTRELPPVTAGSPADAAQLVIGIPLAEQLGLANERGYAAAWEAATAALAAAGVSFVELDISGLLSAGTLLYEGPWLAERLSGVEEWVTTHPGSMHPVTRELLERGREVSGTEVFRGIDRLHHLREAAWNLLGGVHALLVPTAATTFSVAELEQQPIARNSELGRFTTFGNLLDLAGIAIPAGFTESGLPFGVSLLGVAGADNTLAAIARSFERIYDVPLGATGHRSPSPGATPVVPAVADGPLLVAVVGAHLEGMPLNPELLALGAVKSATTTTSSDYRLFALESTPPKPGLVRVRDGGAQVDVEIYRIPRSRVGTFLASIDQPLGLGTVRLADGSTVHGFLCEHAAVADALDITSFGGWRQYRASLVSVT